jgi:phosphoribosyl-AMP cyclohydrolase
MSDKELEEGLALRLDFGKLRKIAAGQADVIPAVAQDALTGEVLILGYVNELALQTSLREKKATFWSTSRNELWIKGLTSGDFLELLEVRVNCEQNSILYKVRPAKAPATRRKTARPVRVATTADSRPTVHWRRPEPQRRRSPCSTRSVSISRRTTSSFVRRVMRSVPGRAAKPSAS